MRTQQNMLHGPEVDESLMRLSDEVRAIIAEPLPPFPRLVRQTLASETLTVLIDPSTGRGFAQVVPGGVEEADMVIASALDVMQGEWGAYSANERERLLHRFSELIENDQKLIVELEALATGRALSGLVDLVVPELLAWSHYLAGLPSKMDGHTSADPGLLEPFRCSFREPKGVAVIRIRAEESLTQRLVPLISALAAGCAVILLSNDAAYPGLYCFCELLTQAGIPVGAVSLLCIGETMEMELLNHSFVFAPQALQGRSEQPATSRMFVFEDADIDMVVETLITRVLSPINPSFTSPRLHVHESIYEDFIEAAKGQFQRIKIGNALDSTTELGPLYNADVAHEVVSLIDICRAKGLRVVCGGSQSGEGNSIEPTLIADDQLTLAHLQINLLIPIIVVQPFSHEDRIVRRANRDSGCQGVSMFTYDLQRIRRLSRALSTEQLWVNSHNRMDPGDKYDPLAPYLRRRNLWIDS